MFDAVIVLTSFSLDLVFIEGITGPESEEAIALLIIFLLWRILRIINGNTRNNTVFYCVMRAEEIKGPSLLLVVLTY